MKKNVLVVLGLLVLVVSTGSVFAGNILQKDNFTITKQANITLEEAKKIALKKMAGEIEDEFAVEDDDGNITSYVFVIKNKAGKSFEVEVDAKTGKVLSSEEIVEEIYEEPPVDTNISQEFEVVETAEETEAVEAVQSEEKPAEETPVVVEVNESEPPIN